MGIKASEIPKHIHNGRPFSWGSLRLRRLDRGGIYWLEWRGWAVGYIDYSTKSARLDMVGWNPSLSRQLVIIRETLVRMGFTLNG